MEKVELDFEFEIHCNLINYNNLKLVRLDHVPRVT